MNAVVRVVDTRLPALLRGARPLLGMFIGLPQPALVEMCGHAGFDFVVIDNERGPAGVWFSSRYARRRLAGTHTDRLEGVSQAYHEKPREKPDRREPEGRNLAS